METTLEQHKLLPPSSKQINLESVVMLISMILIYATEKRHTLEFPHQQCIHQLGKSYDNRSTSHFTELDVCDTKR